MKKTYLHIFIGIILLFLSSNLKATNSNVFFDEDLPQNYTLTEKVQEVLIYPNPVLSGHFKIKGDNVHTIEVLSVVGQTIVKADYDLQNQEAMLVPLNNCTKGIYLVKVTFQDKTVQIKKILVK